MPRNSAFTTIVYSVVIAGTVLASYICCCQQCVTWPVMTHLAAQTSNATFSFTFCLPGRFFNWCIVNWWDSHSVAAMTVSKPWRRLKPFRRRLFYHF